MATIDDYRKKQQYIRKANEVEQQYGIPQNLLVGVMGAESSFNNNAVSKAGAKGLLQFMPETAKRFGINPLNPSQSIEAAGKYLAQNYKMFGDWDQALMAYNAGEGRIGNWKKGIGKPLTKETLEYVGRVRKNANIENYATPISDQVINSTNQYFLDHPTTDITYLDSYEDNSNLAVENQEEVVAEEEKDEDIEDVKQQTKEQNFLQEYQSIVNQQSQPIAEQVVEQEMPQQAPPVDLTEIYKNVSQFVDQPYAQQGIIKSQDGQRRYPNKTTEIQGNTMATDGYGDDIILYTVPDVGQPKIVYPNTGEHIFPQATKFTEYPITEREKNFLKHIAKLR